MTNEAINKRRADKFLMFCLIFPLALKSTSFSIMALGRKNSSPGLAFITCSGFPLIEYCVLWCSENSVKTLLLQRSESFAQPNDGVYCTNKLVVNGDARLGVQTNFPGAGSLEPRKE
ncbi:hypothetical protein BDN72DRAFT_468007 [Pluteus cervinus]|uniref:Uncharacterized protein n=1 Tax=Pluteus cervinus TaxID=181527 RepID=A0ACD3B0X4_9AGAR|nr:hypothetical protein BDN72DRAFT_468007 [Pluteus cervinus]